MDLRLTQTKFGVQRRKRVAEGAVFQLLDRQHRGADKALLAHLFALALRLESRRIPGHIAKDIDRLRELALWRQRIGHTRNHGQTVRSGDGSVDRYRHQRHVMAAACIPGDKMSHHVGADDLLRGRETALCADNSDRIVLALVFAGDGVQAVGRNRDHLLVRITA